MEIDLSDYSIETLIELKDKISGIIYNHNDGYLYICNVRSYGRNWRESWIYNTHTLQELCHRYFGEDGIVDVYSTNPDLSKIENYGDIMYIVSEDDYHKWENHQHLLRMIPRIQKDLDEWETRMERPFNQRPYFKPIFTKDDLDNMKKELEDYDMSFVPPIRYSDKI